MIAKLTGIIDETRPTEVIIDVHGVGYRVHISLLTQEHIKKGETISLYTFAIYREDAAILYGFLEKQEQEIFTQIIKISGIGPKAALNILSHLSPKQVRAVIGNAEVDTLKKIEGIGKKTAEKIIFELKPLYENDQDAATPNIAGDIKDDAIAALVNLGYNQKKAEEAVHSACKSDPEGDVENIVKAVLQNRPL